MPEIYDIIPTKICTKCHQEFPATKKYFHKHNEGRYGLRPNCIQCRLAYAREYTEMNKERVYSKNRAYRHANKERNKKRARMYYKENKDKFRAYRKAHRHKDRLRCREYKSKNKDKILMYVRQRRAQKRGAAINDFTHAQWVAMQKHYDYRCVYCGKRRKGKLTQDHITPLSRQGNHTVSNIVPACSSCNSQKHIGPPLSPVQPLLFIIEGY